MLQAHIDAEAGSRQSTCHEVMEVARWTKGIERVHECAGERLQRPDLRRLPGLVERRGTAGMREEAGDATPGGVQRLMSTPAKAGAGSTSGMPGWLTTVSGTTLWVIRVTPMANWQWTELPALVKTRAGSQDRSHAGQSVAVAPRRGGMAGTGRGAFDYLLSGCGWGPVRSPGRGPPAANAWLTPASPERPPRW